MICSGTVSVRAVASVTMRRTRACPCEESHTGVCYSSRTNHPELCPSRISCTNGISSKSCAPFCLTCVCTRAAYVPAMHCRVAKPLNLTASNSRCVLNEAGLWVSILRASQQRRGEHEIECISAASGRTRNRTIGAKSAGLSFERSLLAGLDLLGCRV